MLAIISLMPMISQRNKIRRNFFLFLVKLFLQSETFFDNSFSLKGSELTVKIIVVKELTPLIG